jgi:hypothetical protein
MQADRTGAEQRERIGFHGTSVHHARVWPALTDVCSGSALPNLYRICCNGLLRVGHSLNPSKAVDEGFFGLTTHGVYVSRYADYSLKYSNGMEVGSCLELDR